MLYKCLSEKSAHFVNKLVILWISTAEKHDFSAFFDQQSKMNVKNILIR